jgi:hypothetical protein
MQARPETAAAADWSSAGRGFFGPVNWIVITWINGHFVSATKPSLARADSPPPTTADGDRRPSPPPAAPPPPRRRRPRPPPRAHSLAPLARPTAYQHPPHPHAHPATDHITQSVPTALLAAGRIAAHTSLSTARAVRWCLCPGAPAGGPSPRVPKRPQRAEDGGADQKREDGDGARADVEWVSSSRKTKVKRSWCAASTPFSVLRSHHILYIHNPVPPSDQMDRWWF